MKVGTYLLYCVSSKMQNTWDAIWIAYRQCVNVHITLLSSWYAFRQVFPPLLGNHCLCDHLLLYLYHSICISVIWSGKWQCCYSGASQYRCVVFHSNHLWSTYPRRLWFSHPPMWQYPVAAITARFDAKRFLRNEVVCFSPARLKCLVKHLIRAECEAHSKVLS